MKSISIYAITRKQNLTQLSRMERQLSKREKPLKMREWELDSLKNLVEQLETRMQDVCGLRFFYSFQIPRLGKEFDLLQIKEDQIINIELKSGAVSEEAMRRLRLGICDPAAPKPVCRFGISGGTAHADPSGRL